MDSKPSITPDELQNLMKLVDLLSTSLEADLAPIRQAKKEKERQDAVKRVSGLRASIVDLREMKEAIKEELQAAETPAEKQELVKELRQVEMNLSRKHSEAYELVKMFRVKE